jgi:WD40 repeat protein
MSQHLKNIENITKISEDTFSITYKARSLYLTLKKQGNTLYPKLYEELKVRNISLSDAKKHKSFNDCASIDHIEEKLKRYLTQGKVEIVEDQNKYHLVLFDNISDVKESYQPQIDQNKNELSLEKIQVFQDNITNSIDKIYKRLETEFFKNSVDNLQKGYLQSKTHIKKVLNKEELFKECFDELDKLTSAYKKRRTDDFGNNENNLKELNNQKIKERLNSMKGISSINTPTSINSMLLLPNGTVALGTEDFVYIWEPKNNTLNFKFHHQDINNLSVLPNGNLICMRPYCSSLFIWDMVENKLKELYLLNGKIVKCFLVLNSGKLAVAVGCEIFIIDKVSNIYKIIHTFNAHKRPITALANFLEDQFVSCCKDNLNIWDCNYKIVKSIDLNEVVDTLLTLPNKYIVAKSLDKITIFNLNKDLIKSTFQKKGVTTIALFQDYYLVLGCLNGDLEVWNIQGDKCLYTLKENGKAVSTVLALEDSLFVAYSDQTLNIWKI